MRGRVFYGWWIVGAMFIALMVGSGLTFWSFTVYIPPLEDEFGWSRAQVASAFSVGVIVSGITAPMAGRVVGGGGGGGGGGGRGDGPVGQRLLLFCGRPG